MSIPRAAGAAMEHSGGREMPRRGNHGGESRLSGERKYTYKVFLVGVFNVWNGVKNGTLVVPTFQEVTAVFSTTVPSAVGFETRPMAW